MSGSKKNIKAAKEVEFIGKVYLKKTSTGSKSERIGVYLKTDSGDFALRKLGGNPFNDDGLNQLEGKTVAAKGVLDNNLLLAKEIKTKD